MMLCGSGNVRRSRIRTQVWTTHTHTHTHTHEISSCPGDILNYKVYQGVCIGNYFSVREWTSLKTENWLNQGEANIIEIENKSGPQCNHEVEMKRSLQQNTCQPSACARTCPRGCWAGKKHEGRAWWALHEAYKSGIWSTGCRVSWIYMKTFCLWFYTKFCFLWPYLSSIFFFPTFPVFS